MTIQEAIAARTCREPYITREKWIDECEEEITIFIKIRPTDSPAGCLVKVMEDAMRSRWQPTRDDLMATGWFPTC